MRKCEWRDKPGGDENCKLIAQGEGIYCPRHQMMYEFRKQQREDKAANKDEAQRLGVAGKLPPTRRQMFEKGYVFKGNNTCEGCGKPIEWWQTPNLRRAPFDPMPHEGSFSKSHFATCERRADFRRAS